MKFKKAISVALLSCLFINNTFLFAGTLSEDGRYETFEGNNITIDKVLEENIVDVEIEGNTLVNLGLDLDLSKYSYVSKNVLIEDDYIKMIGNGDNHITLRTPLLPLKTSTNYTLVLYIKENTLSHIFNAVQDSNNSQFNSEIHIPNNETGVYKKLLRTRDDFSNATKGLEFRIWYNITGDISFKYLLLEGDWTDKEIPEYFEGMKSVGQNDENSHKIEILSKNKTYQVNNKEWREQTWYIDNQGNILEGNGDRYKSIIFNNIQGLTNYVLKANTKVPHFRIAFYDKNDLFISRTLISNIDTANFTAPTNTSYIVLVLNYFSIEGFTLTLTQGNEFIESQLNKKEILLSEPLRALPNGVRDKIIKRNGQWVIERNCGELILDGNETWKQYNSGYNENEIIRLYTDRPVNALRPIDNNHRKYIVCDKLYTPNDTMDAEGMSLNQFPLSTYISHGTGTLSVALPKEVLSSFDEIGFKNWLSLNRPTIIYQLVEPIYEPLNIDSTLNTYLDITHISNNSNIPANMKVTIDRTMNRAVEAIELAEIDPTTENLSDARYWTNLLKESIKKDELQSVITNIIGPSDIELERKTVSANTDVYVKSENMLSMSLGTNSISFDDYSGVEDMEMLDAVNITINSSLPYSLNAYMPNDITSNSSNQMNKDVLNIRDNSEEDYQSFNDSTSKLVLKDGCAEGNNKQHSIDLKLASDNAHTADVYRAIIKFEAEQK